MFIKEITIDGFKSYAQRVVVPQLDPQFNAITGLNGSGKSNILDSICFVLGITNLQQVRLGACGFAFQCSGLFEGEYKRGRWRTQAATGGGGMPALHADAAWLVLAAVAWLHGRKQHSRNESLACCRMQCSA